MQSIRRVLFWLLLGLAGVGEAHAQAGAGEARVALVIGESFYDGTDYRSLRNAENDARQVAYALADAGFSIYDPETRAMADCSRDRERCRPVRSATGAQLREALQAFGAAAANADVALIYYSGHGVSRGGRNYLVPSSDGPIADDDYIPVLDLVGAVRPARRDRILVIDACRDAGNERDSFVPKEISAASDGSFTKIYQLFATSSGNPSYDASPFTPDLSPFAAAFTRAVRTPGSTLDEVLRLVQADVQDATRGYGKPQFPVGINQLGGGFAFRALAASRDTPIASPVFGDTLLATRTGADLLKIALQKESLRSLEAKANAGDYSAAYILTQYFMDRGEDAAALGWARKAADSGTPAGRHILAVALYRSQQAPEATKGLGVGKVEKPSEGKYAVFLRSMKENWEFPKARYAYAYERNLQNDGIANQEYWSLIGEAADQGVQAALRDYVVYADDRLLEAESDLVARRVRTLLEYDPEDSQVLEIRCKLALKAMGNWDQPECEPTRFRHADRLRVTLAHARLFGSSEWGTIKASARLDYVAAANLLKSVAEQGSDHDYKVYAAYLLGYMYSYGLAPVDSTNRNILPVKETALAWRAAGARLCAEKRTASCTPLEALPQ